MSEEDIESPYCEVCGTCGYIGCCGIRNFIEEHIKDKTNCKNEDIIINELIDLCDYKDYVFEENKKLKSQLQQKENIIKEVRKYIEKYDFITGYYEHNYDEGNDTYTHYTVKEELLEIIREGE